jgi:hypothetical protein
MSWNTDGQLVERIVADLRRRGVAATAEQVRNALGHHGHGEAPMGTKLEEARRAAAAARAGVATLVGQDRAAAFAREVETEVVRERVIAVLDDSSGAVRVYVPPGPVARQKKADPSEGRVPAQRTSSEELADLRAEAKTLQAIIADPSALATEKARAQSALDPILSRIKNLEIALGGTTPAATGQSQSSAPNGATDLFIEPEPYFTRKERTA